MHPNSNFPSIGPQIENNLNLCPLCHPYGYCRNILPLHQTKQYQWKDFIDMVPLQVVNAGRVRCGKAGKQHLQNAYDAFHQQDYETAILRFHSVLEESATVEEAMVGLAISYFFMADYENASRYMMYYGEAKPFKPTTDIVNSFQDLCIEGTEMSAAVEPDAPSALVSLHGPTIGGCVRFRFVR